MTTASPICKTFFPLKVLLCIAILYCRSTITMRQTGHVSGACAWNYDLLINLVSKKGVMNDHTVKYFNKERIKCLQCVLQDQFALLRNIFKLNVTDNKEINSGKRNSISDSAGKSIFSQTTAFDRVDTSAR